MNPKFLLIDVFTEKAFGGNQLAVFPHAEEIPPQHLQPIARELNFTETTFVYGAKTAGTSPRLRIFTPDAEVPYAGHPVIGTAFVLESLGLSNGESNVHFELEAGSVPVRLDRAENGDLVQATMTQERPVFLGPFHRTELVAGALGLDPHQILITGLPCEVVSTGLPIHIVPLGDLEAMRSIRIQPGKVEELVRVLGFGDLFVFCFETVDPTASVHCRMFAPSFGIPEDPATGSASGCLGAYLVKNRVVTSQRICRIVSEQGLEMGRPSRIAIEVETEGGQIRAVRVGGSAVIVGEGELRL